MAVAQFLEQYPATAKVYYPRIESYPDPKIAAAAKGIGVVSFTLT